jgi:sugar/nucleoside kinase (ribokinase family)
LAFVDIDENGERHFAFNRFNSADYHIDYSRLEVIKDADIIHVGSLMLREQEGIELARYIYKKAKDLNKKISFDVNFRDDIYTSKEEAINIYLEFIKEADILKFSEEEIELFTNNKDVKEGLKTLVNEEQLVFVSLGSKGSYYQYKGESATVETFKVKPVDTTGAGDAFYACILAYLDKVDNRNKSTIVEIMKHANICGALACLKKGALSSLPTSEELKERYKNLY